MDEDGWLTKAEAAEQLGVNARTVERLAARGALTAKARPGFPTMYNREDVEKVASAGRLVHRGAVTAAFPDASVSGNGHGTLARHEDTPDRAVEQLLRFLDAVSKKIMLGGPTGPTGPTVVGPLYVTVDEAARITGLSRPTIRRMVTEGRLPAERDRGGIKIRREAL